MYFAFSPWIDMSSTSFSSYPSLLILLSFNFPIQISISLKDLENDFASLSTQVSGSNLNTS